MMGVAGGNHSVCSWRPRRLDHEKIAPPSTRDENEDAPRKDRSTPFRCR